MPCSNSPPSSMFGRRTGQPPGNVIVGVVGPPSLHESSLMHVLGVLQPTPPSWKSIPLQAEMQFRKFSNHLSPVALLPFNAASSASDNTQIRIRYRSGMRFSFLLDANACALPGSPRSSMSTRNRQARDSRRPFGHAQSPTPVKAILLAGALRGNGPVLRSPQTPWRTVFWPNWQVCELRFVSMHAQSSVSKNRAWKLPSKPPLTCRTCVQRPWMHGLPRKKLGRFVSIEQTWLPTGAPTWPPCVT